MAQKWSTNPVRRWRVRLGDAWISLGGRGSIAFKSAKAARSPQVAFVRRGPRGFGAPTARARGRSNLNFVFRLPLKFYRLISAAVERQHQRPAWSEARDVQPSLAEIQWRNRPWAGSCGKEPLGSRPERLFSFVFLPRAMPRRLAVVLGQPITARARPLIGATCRASIRPSRRWEE